MLGPTGVFAIFTAMNDDQQMHYVLKDHQGSLMGLADVDGRLVESYSYDAFGRRRNADNWSYNNITTSTITDRGYTFHEHLDEFGLINMNGRVYDPLIGHVLSPDPFIQQPEYSQSYNRYGYVFNNPLRYTDPSGYFAQGDSTGMSNRPLMQLHLPINKDAIPYITNTDIALNGPEEFSLKVEKEEYTPRRTRAGETMSQTLLLSAQASRIPPLAMIILGTGTLMTSYYYLKENYAGEGFENYPGPLSYTFEHPSQNPIHQNQDNRGGGDDGKWHNWFVGGAFSVGIIYYYLKSENMKTQEINESLNGKNDHLIQKNDHYINNIQHIQLKEDYYKYRKK
ncbi:MAG: RHS repeat-associated core domain-containing protein [Bacteroidales bacterium]|nr:RHS repeat-associated core domain-containing protein [Bacteroidales bacterium]